MTSASAPLAAAELEVPDCNLCGANDPEPVLRAADVRRRVPGVFTVVRCRRCGLAYVSPRPTACGIARYYPPGYAPHGLAASSAAERLYYRSVRRLPVAAGARVLDVGCGGGRYLRALREAGYAVSGTDVDFGLAARLHEELGLDVHAGALPDVDLPAGSFDAITLWWVLEHTHDPVATLRAAHRLLRPGGWIVVSVQNFASLGRLLFGRFWHHLDVPGHLYQFEPATLRAALELAGFAIQRLRHDLVAKDFAPSIGYAIGLERSLDVGPLNLAALPFDLVSWLSRRSGLITAYATRADR